MTDVNHQQRVRQLFDGKAGAWQAKYRGPLRERAEVFMRALVEHGAPGGTVLDFGCGTGDLMLRAAQLGFRVSGVDISPEMIEACRAQLDRHGIDAELARGDLEAVRSSLGRFDAVLCSSVLEYVPDPKHTLSMLAQLLEKDGVVIASLPNRAAISRRLESVLQRLAKQLRAAPSSKLRGYGEYLELSAHRYLPTEVDGLAAAAGLRVVALRHFGARYEASLLSPMLLVVMRRGG